MRIALSGYGKMGHMIEAVAIEKGHQVVARIDPLAPDADRKTKLCADCFRGADIVIDFSAPDQAVANIRTVMAAGLPMVIGTTGWLDRLDEVKALVKASGVSAVYGSNYSIGVQLFYKMVREAARLMNAFPEYDAAGWELHHNQKVDSPSGTAKSIGRILIDGLDRKTELVTEAFDRKPEPQELHMASVRVGTVPGTHSVIFDSFADSIELTHTARNREGFARGAVWAAQWIQAHPGKGLLEADEVFGYL